MRNLYYKVKIFFLNIIINYRLNKAEKTTANFVRDKYGRWLTNPETGDVLRKTDDPALIAKVIAQSDRRNEELIKILREERTCKCGGDGMCKCKEGEKMRHPASNGGKLPLQQAEELEKKKKATKPTPKKTPSETPVAKKPTTPKKK